MILNSSQLERLNLCAGISVTKFVTVLFLFAISSSSFGFEIHSVNATRVSENMVSVEVNYEIELSQDVVEALESSIPITVLTRVRFYRARANLWDKLVHEYELGEEISYRSLYRTYRLSSSDRTINGDYQSLDRVLETIGRQRVHRLKLLEGKFDPNENYIGKVRIWLDRSSLPSAMRLPVFFKNSWRLQTEKVEFVIE